MSANMSASRPLTPTYTAAYNHVVMLVGRLLIASLFIQHGYMKLTNYAGTVKYFANWGFPMPEVTAVISIIFEVGFGILLAIGWKTRWWAWAFIPYVIIATAVAHRYWTYEGAQWFTQFSFFNKNLAVIGGLLYIAMCGPGRYSVDKV